MRYLENLENKGLYFSVRTGETTAGLVRDVQACLVKGEGAEQ